MNMRWKEGDGPHLYRKTGKTAALIWFVLGSHHVKQLKTKDKVLNKPLKLALELLFKDQKGVFNPGESPAAPGRNKGGKG